jgi:hypothetical protein
MKNRIIISNLIIEGVEYKRVLPFKDGLNIINGDRTSGKSLVLTLIDYCFGKSSKIDSNVQPELFKYIDKVSIEIIYGDDIITIQRSLKSNYNNFLIYYTSYEEIGNYTPKILKRDDFLDLIMIELDIPQIKIGKHKAHTNEKTLERITLRDIMKFVYVDQHDFGTNNFMKYNNISSRYKLAYSFEIIMNLIETDINDLQNEKVYLENNVLENNNNIRGLKAYINDKGYNDESQIDIYLNKIQSELNELRSQKEDIIKNIVNKKDKKEDIFIKVKKEIYSTDLKISKYEIKTRELEFSLYKKHNLLVTYQKDKDELKTTLDAMFRIKTEDHNVTCPLCESQVTFKGNQGISIDDMSKSIQTIDKKAKLVKEIIEKDNKELNKLKSELEEFKEYKELLQKSLVSYEKNLDTPYLSEIETLNKLIINLNTQNNNMLEIKKIYNKIYEIEKLNDKIKKRISSIVYQIKDLNSSITDKYELLKMLNDDYLNYMLRFKYQVDEAEVYIDSNDYYPYYNGAVVFKHTSGGLLECMQIAYLISLINRKINNINFNHPGFLMLDTLGKYLGTNSNNKDYIKDPEVYEEMYKILIEISKDVQILVVDNTPPNIVKNYIEYTFYDDGRGLIDMNVNHKILN